MRVPGRPSCATAPRIRQVGRPIGRPGWGCSSPPPPVAPGSLRLTGQTCPLPARSAPSGPSPSPSHGHPQRRPSGRGTTSRAPTAPNSASNTSAASRHRDPDPDRGPHDQHQRQRRPDREAHQRDHRRLQRAAPTHPAASRGSSRTWPPSGSTAISRPATVAASARSSPAAHTRRSAWLARARGRRPAPAAPDRCRPARRHAGS